MRKLTLMLALVAFVLVPVLGTAQQAMSEGKNSVAIYGHGNSKCSDYNKYRFDENEQILKNYQVWMNGMLYAYNTFVSKDGDVANGVRSDELMSWVRDFCELNPDTFFQRAAIELLRALESGQF